MFDKVKKLFSLRIKFLIVLLVISAVPISLVSINWLPTFKERHLSIYKENNIKHLGTLLNSLIPFMIQNQFSAIYETLDGIIERHDDWEGLELYNSENVRVYPLDPIEKTESENLIYLEKSINFRGQNFAKIVLKLNVKEELNVIKNQNNALLLEITLGYLLLIILGAVFLDQVVGKKILAMKEFARDIISGEKRVNLNVKGFDEIAQLAFSLTQMRIELEMQRNEIIQEKEKALSSTKSKSIFWPI